MSLKLYYGKTSPFSQKPWIALLEKRIPFELVETNPRDKSRLWLSVSPTGLIPVLDHDGRRIYESDVVVEYIHDAFKGPPMLPCDPYRRAMIRIWLNFVNELIVPSFFAVLMSRGLPHQKKYNQMLLDAFLEISKAMDAEGPFFDGDYLSLVDIALIPFALRYDHIISHFRGFVIPASSEFDRFRSWYSAVKRRPSVEATIPSKFDWTHYLDMYKNYANGTATSNMAVFTRKWMKSESE